MLDQPIEGQSLYQLLPHAEEMRLIDKVTDWDKTSISCLTRSHLKPSNPLRNHDQLAAIHAAEYGAQAMALHGGLLAQSAGQRQPGGYLVSLRGVKLHTQRLDTLDQDLVIEAIQMLSDKGNMLYDFLLKTDETVIANGRAAVIVHTEETP